MQRSPFSMDFRTALVKVITMVGGDFGFEDSFSLFDDNDPSGSDKQFVTSLGVPYLIWIVFIVTMPILLSTMLVR